MRRKEKSFTFIGDVFSVISNWASVLSFAGVSAAALMTCLKQYFWASCIGTLAVLLFVFFRICFKCRDKIIKSVLRWFAPNSSYSYEEWNAEYEYKSLTCMSFRTRYKVKALQSGVKNIRVRFNWSGASESSPIIPKPFCADGYTTKEVKYAGEEYGYTYYDVINQTSFNKGDTPVMLGVDIEDMKTNDPQKISHHLLTSVNVVTDQLNMTILFPQNICPKNIVAHEYLHATDDNHWRERSSECSRVFRDDNKWEVTWKVKDPVYGGKYIVHWNPELINN